MEGLDLDERWAVVPAGTVTLERAAFRGRRELTGVALPESLEEICDLAFSCTSLEELRLPARCARLSTLALRTGPEFVPGVDRAYRSTIKRVEVDPANPRYVMCGPVLCERLSDGSLEAMFCPGAVEEVALPRDVSRIAPTAFDGTYSIGALRFHESIAVPPEEGLSPHATCGRVVIDLDEPEGAFASIDMKMPSAALQRRVFAATRGAARIDVAAFCIAYDDALPEEGDRLLQMQLMLARVAAPAFLEAAARDAFMSALSAAFDNLCVQFGARGYWEGFGQMADAGLLDERGVSRAVDVLGARDDAEAVARMLQLRKERFGTGGWDYAL